MNEQQPYTANPGTVFPERRFMPNSFINFMVSVLPGAGHMYQGLLSRGVLLMGAFAACILCSALFSGIRHMGVLSGLLNGIFIAGIVIIYFYAFFESMKTCRMIRMGLKESEELSLSGFKLPSLSQMRGGRTAVGTILLVIGLLGTGTMLLNRYVDPAIIQAYIRPATELLLPLGFVVCGVILIIRGRSAARERV